MKLDRYEFDVHEEDAYVQYEFFSHGSKGVIRKFIRFYKLDDTFYNLSFGDNIIGTEDFSDEMTSNNGDTEKVLITVAAASMKFSLTYPGVMINAEGSTPARSRLYRIYLNKYRKIINKYFFIYGRFTNGDWEKFRKNENYIALAVKRKNY